MILPKERSLGQNLALEEVYLLSLPCCGKTRVPVTVPSFSYPVERHLLSFGMNLHGNYGH